MAVGTEAAFDAIGEIGGEAPVDDEVLTGSTLLGLAMFTTLFLGCVLAVFLTLGAVRGDAERGLLQPLVVRPLGRSALLAGRFAAAAGVCAAYVGAVYLAALLITAAAGGWWPDHPVAPGLGLMAGVVVIAALSLLGSVFLSSTANGIAVFMAFGAGLAAGLLGQIGDALDVESLQTVARGDLVAAALRGALPSRPRRPDLRRERRDRRDRAARPIRRGAGGRHAAVAVDARLSRGGGGGHAGGVRPPRPLAVTLCGA